MINRFWDVVNKAKEEVSKWPDWKKEGADVVKKVPVEDGEPNVPEATISEPCESQLDNNGMQYCATHDCDWLETDCVIGSGLRYLDSLQSNIHDLCKLKGWDKDWNTGGCYIHLEVSEFIESLRGKGDSHPIEEAGDVLFTLAAVLANYGYKLSDVISALENKMDDSN